jgi:hypothetical protein
MLILLPVVLLLLAALTLLFLQWLRPGFGLSWLIGVGLTLAAWVLILYLRLHLVIQVTLMEWKPVTLFNESPMFLLDRISWPYAFCLVTLVLGVVLTATARAMYHSNPFTWAGSLLTTALGLLAVISGNPLTLMFSWAAIDLAELIILLSSISEGHLSQRVVIAFSSRIIGIFFLIWAVIVSKSGSIGSTQVFDFTNIPAEAGIFLLLASGLRLGVFPLHLPFSQEPRLRRGLGSVLRLVPVASALALLGRLPSGSVPDSWVPILMALAILAVFYSGVMWLKAPDELIGRPYWFIGWAALSLICVINGSASESTAWGVAAILPGSLLFLFSAREKQIYFIPVLGFIGLTGLPFTPAASGWHGLLGSGFSIISLLIILSVSMLILGYIRHSMRSGDQMTKVERWARVTYPLGLLVFVVADYLLGLWGWPGSRTVGVWWAGLLTGILVSLAGYGYYRRSEITLQVQGLTIFGSPLVLNSVKNYFNRMMSILRLDWFYKILIWVFRAVGDTLEGATRILEGDGGVLWAFVIMSLLTSLLLQGGLH